MALATAPSERPSGTPSNSPTKWFAISRCLVWIIGSASAQLAQKAETLVLAALRKPRECGLLPLDWVDVKKLTKALPDPLIFFNGGKMNTVSRTTKSKLHTQQLILQSQVWPRPHLPSPLRWKSTKCPGTRKGQHAGPSPPPNRIRGPLQPGRSITRSQNVDEPDGFVTPTSAGLNRNDREATTFPFNQLGVLGLLVPPCSVQHGSQLLHSDMPHLRH